MYLPEVFRQDRIEAILSAIERTRLATLVSASQEGLEVSHLPMIAKACGSDLVLEGHLSMANPHVKALRESSEALAIFLGPDAYVSAGWYPTKRETGKVVPTWNYVTVHVRGVVQTFTDPTELLKHLNELTELNEHGRPEPWAVADAPAEYTRQLLCSIVGVRLVSARIEGKWKMSQNRSTADRCGVIRGLQAEGPAAADAATTMLELERARGDLDG